MNTIFLYIHIAAGFSALLLGIIAIFATQRQTVHKTTGAIFFWAINIVAITSVVLSLNRTPINSFLLVIGILSFYVNFTGYRAVKLKNKPAQFADKLVTGIMFLTTLSMLFLAAYDSKYGSGDTAIILGIFSIIGGTHATADALYFKNGPRHPKEWILRHFNGMVGAYIATITAFAVTNLTAFVPLFYLWTIPPVIGSLFVLSINIYYRRKYIVSAE